MARRRAMHRMVHRLSGLLVSVAMVAAVTGALLLVRWALPWMTARPFYPPTGLLMLYMLVVIPIALVWGTPLATLTSVLSTLTYKYMFLPPLHSLSVDPGFLVAMCVFVVVTVVISELAARVGRLGRASAELADVQSALRRVAVLVTRSVSPVEVFEAVTAEVVQLLRLDVAVLVRFEPDGPVTVLGRTACGAAMGTGAPVEAPEALSWVRESGRSVRVDAVGDVSGLAALVGVDGAVAVACCPVRVEGRVWGALVAGSSSDRLPHDAEHRLERFAELVATAVASAETRTELAASRARAVAAADETRCRLERDLHDGAQQRLVTLMFGLRLVAAGVPEDLPGVQKQIGRAADELTEIIEGLRDVARGIHPATLSEHGLGPTVGTLVRRSAVPVESPSSKYFDGTNARDLPWRRATPRMVSWLNRLLTSVAMVAVVTGGIWLSLSSISPIDTLNSAPQLLNVVVVLYMLGIMVIAMVWGTKVAVLVSVLSVLVYDYLFLPPTHSLHINDARNVVAMCVFVVVTVVISELAARVGRLGRASAELADVQSALRRVAVLVTRSVSPVEVFEAVTAEVVQLLRLDVAVLVRFEPDGPVTVLGGTACGAAMGTGAPVEAPEALSWVRESGRSVRVDAVGDVSGLAALVGVDGAVAVACCPVRVEGRVWGALVAGSSSDRLPHDAEHRLERFAELVATAVASAETRTELAASRARAVAAADETRCRLERDLHDGAQQRLVTLMFGLRLVAAGVPEDLPGVQKQIGRAADELTEIIEGLRDVARGIHPATLSEHGLGPTVGTLVRRSAVPVDLRLDVHGRYPERVEVAAFYVVSEALTNAMQHAGASRVEVTVEERDSVLRLRVRDDGRGSADPSRGTGLIGLRDRVESLEGTFVLSSPPGHGTLIEASLSVADQALVKEEPWSRKS